MSKYFQAEAYIDGIYWGTPDFKRITKSPSKLLEAILKIILKAALKGYEMGLNDGGGSLPQDIVEANVIEKYVEVTDAGTKAADSTVNIYVTCVTDITDDIFDEYPNVPIIKINNFDAIPNTQAQSLSFIKKYPSSTEDFSFIGDFEVLPTKRLLLYFNFGDYSWVYTYQVTVYSSDVKNTIGPIIYHKHYPTGTAAIGGDESLPVVWDWSGVEVGDIIGLVVVHLSEGDETYPVSVTNYDSNTTVTTAQFGNTTIGTITVCDNGTVDSGISFSCPYPVDVTLYTDIYNPNTSGGKNLDK